MFGPERTTSLAYEDYETLIRALDSDVERLRARVLHLRDTFQPLAWAQASSDLGRAASLLRRLTEELATLPAPTADDLAWEANRLRWWALRLPRTKANAALHHAAVVARRKAEEERKAAYWRNREAQRGRK